MNSMTNGGGKEEEKKKKRRQTQFGSWELDICAEAKKKTMKHWINICWYSKPFAPDSPRRVLGVDWKVILSHLPLGKMPELISFSRAQKNCQAHRIHFFLHHIVIVGDFISFDLFVLCLSIFCSLDLFYFADACLFRKRAPQQLCIERKIVSFGYRIYILVL